MTMKGLAILTILVIGFSLLPPFSLSVDAGWWSCLQAAIRCQGAFYTAQITCAVADRYDNETWYRICFAAIRYLIRICNEAERECD